MFTQSASRNKILKKTFYFNPKFDCHVGTLVLYKNGHFIFVFSTINMFITKFCLWLDSNRGPLVVEATVLPTELQPLPQPQPLQLSGIIARVSKSKDLGSKAW